MATDMDIEMDIDMGFTEQDLAVQDIEIVPESEVSFICRAPTSTSCPLNANFS